MARKPLGIVFDFMIKLAIQRENYGYTSIWNK